MERFLKSKKAMMLKLRVQFQSYSLLTLETWNHDESIRDGTSSPHKSIDDKNDKTCERLPYFCMNTNWTYVIAHKSTFVNNIVNFVKYVYISPRVDCPASLSSSRPILRPSPVRTQESKIQIFIESWTHEWLFIYNTFTFISLTSTFLNLGSTNSKIPSW